MSNGGLTGLKKKLSSSTFVFPWEILTEQKGLWLSKKYKQLKAGSSTLFLDFPLSGPNLLSTWPFKVGGIVWCREEGGVFQAVLVESSASKVSPKVKGPRQRQYSWRKSPLTSLALALISTHAEPDSEPSSDVFQL